MSFLRHFSQRLKQHGWFGVIVDVVVVVAGILLAFQLDAWAENRQERRLELVYLERLAEDLESERGRMEAAWQFATSRIEAARLLDRLATDPTLAATEPAGSPGVARITCRGRLS